MRFTHDDLSATAVESDARINLHDGSLVFKLDFQPDGRAAAVNQPVEQMALFVRIDLFGGEIAHCHCLAEEVTIALERPQRATSRFEFDCLCHSRISSIWDDA